MTRNEFCNIVNNQYTIKEHEDSDSENPKVKAVYLQQQKSKYKVSFFEFGDNDNEVFIILHLVNSFNSRTELKLTPEQFFDLFTKQSLF